MWYILNIYMIIPTIYIMSKIQNFIINSPTELIKICTLLQHSQYPSCYVLNGELGTGKTTFVRTFISQFQEDLIIPSPTFTLMNIYHIDKKIIHHFDLYRLSGVDDALEWGFDEFVNDCDFAFVEWAERASELIPHPYTLIDIKFGNHQNERIIDISIII